MWVVVHLIKAKDILICGVCWWAAGSGGDELLTQLRNEAYLENYTGMDHS